MRTPNQGRRPLFGPTSAMSYGLDWFRKHQPGSLFAPIADPLGASHSQRRNLSVGPTFHFGVVVDAVAYVNCYRVLLDRNGGVALCMAAAPTALLPVGVRAINPIAPGATVIVLRHPLTDFGVILGTLPTPSTAAELVLADFVHQASRCGLRVDKVHSAAFQCQHNGTIVDWSAGRPCDSLAVGEWGAISETGLRVILDSYMVQLGVDEATGVTAFYHDQLLRLAGVNWQAFSAGHELEIYLDQKEIHHYEGFTPYPWEQMGLLEPAGDPIRERDPQEVQFDQPHYADWEPADDAQMPFHRSMTCRGYLGQGGRRAVLVPAEAASRSIYGSGPAGEVLFEEDLGLDGRYSLRSAKSVLIARRIAAAPLARRQRPADTEGDTEDNYRFAGVEGRGEPHRVTGEIRAGSDLPHLQHAAGMLDVHAWVFNWLGVHPFHYHAKDWHLGEESAGFAGRAEATIPFATLTSAFYLPAPSPVLKTIDHRYGQVKYFPNQSYLYMPDDGGVIIGDGYGAELRLVGGHATISSAGDVWVKPGRNFNALAGRDVCLRARNSVDVSATDGDLRLKAEHNLHMLGGGVLVECSAPSAYVYQNVVGEDVVTGGFQLKVPKGEAAIWARSVYVRTGGGDVESGPIVLDADRGKEEIVLQANTIQNLVASGIVDSFGSEGKATAVNYWSAAGNMLAGPLRVQGSGIFAGPLVVKGWVESIGGHFASELAQQYHGQVGVMAGVALDLVRHTLDDSSDEQKKLRDDVAGFWYAAFEQGWYAAQRAGDDDTIDAVHFSFRNPAQYRTESFRIFEDRWQQLARLSGQQLAVWKERSVPGAEETMPYPGLGPWANQATYLEQDLRLHDAETGGSRSRAKARAAYEDPEFATPTPRVPDYHYLVIP
jgi:hypothetical protein